jgi:HlyD family type I secretion membrane fusion protein
VKAVLALAGIALFISFLSLGTWQVQRRAWKLDLIERVNTRVHGAPVPVPAAAAWPQVQPPTHEYLPVQAQGQWMEGRSVLTQAVTELGAGFWLLTPLQQADGSQLLVNRGFVPAEQRKDFADRIAAAPREAAGATVTVEGLLRRHLADSVFNIKFQRQAFEELGRVEAQIQRTRELLSDAVGQRIRTEIRSPSDGVVKNIRYTTVGGVVKPGDPIMEIVPADDTLVVEAKLNPVDRGYVREGPRAVVKVTAYEFVRYGGLEGRVALIAADSTTENNGNVFFRVVVETDRGYLGDEPGQYPVVAGMQASVDIHTGARNVIDYLVRPILKLRHEAFRER